MINEKGSIRILVAEDHGLMREGICALVQNISGIEVVGQAVDGIDAIEKVATLKPNIVLMDIAMPELNGLEATVRICREYHYVRVIILSMYMTEEYVLQALRAGAAGYLLKTARSADLKLAIQTVARGSTYLAPDIATLVADYLKNPADTSPLSRLTSRQREVLQLITEGYTTKNIAAKLHISERTVDKHRSRLMNQIDVHDIPGLVRFAIRTGMITSDN